MNEKDFYKQLMSEYSFDHEKIKKAAMGKIIEPAKKRTPMKWISATCAAAAVALTVGTVAIMAPGNPVSVTPTNSVSVEERFKLALEAYEQADQNTEEVFLYVTFMNNETPSDMQNILARADSTGEIKVIEVYTAGGNTVSGSTNIKDLFTLNEENIVAVKIRCPGNFIKRLTDDFDVYLVETDKPFENTDFSAIDTNVSHDIYSTTTETDTSVTQTEVPEDITSSTQSTASPESSVAPETPAPVIGDTTPVKEEEQEETTVGTSQTEAPEPETSATKTEISQTEAEIPQTETEALQTKTEISQTEPEVIQTGAEVQQTDN